MKSAARRILGPIARPFLWRMRRFTALRTEVDELRAVLPAVVNAAASVAAVGHEQARMKREHDKAIAELRAAIAQLRNEPAGEARIVSTDKVARARVAGLKLHLGTAGTPREGSVHVDTHEAAGIDVVSRWDALPFDRGEVAEICSWHVLERVSHEEAVRLLAYWASLLQPGGKLCAVVFDGRAIVGGAAQGGEQAFDQMRATLFGVAPVRNVFTSASLAAAFRAAGLTDVQTVAEARGTAGAYELEVAGRTAR